MRKTNVKSLELPRLGPRRTEAQPDFAATVPWWPMQVNEEVPVWHESSYELRHGMDMSEEPLETLPGELRELFPKA